MSYGHSRGSERGQILMIAALVLPLLLGMAALAVDIGSYSSHRRQLQNDADAIALAASRDLPNAANAQATANAYAAKNHVDPADMTVTVIPQGGAVLNPTVRVVIQNTHSFAFIGALGVGAKGVSASAAAIKTSPGGSGSVMPWAVPEAVRQSAAPGSPVILKYDSNNVSNGNFGAIRLDGNGASDYQSSIENGSSSVICAQGVSTCTETSPVCNGPICPSKTGNMVGPTRDGVDYRMTNTDSHCNDFDTVFTGPAGGPYTLNPQCNPWLPSSYPSLRVIIVPIIANAPCSGTCDMTVTAFGLFWLDGYDNGKCQGNSCEINGRFVNAEVTTNALTGIYDPASSLHFTRLSE